MSARPPALTFEIIQSNDGLIAKRARVHGGFVYLFQEWDEGTGRVITATSCFVPDPPFPGPQVVKLSADDLHALSER
jgi:hypothetical protein